MDPKSAPSESPARENSLRTIIANWGAADAGSEGAP